MDHRILVITNCSKKKLTHASKAIQLYQGQFFNKVVNFTRRMNFDLKIISAKYGLISPEKIIKPYDKKINNSEVIKLREGISESIKVILDDYDKIIFLMGRNYLKCFEDYLDNPKMIIAEDNRGSGGFLQLITCLEKIPKKKFLKFIKSNPSTFSVKDVSNIGVRQCLI